MFLKNKEDVENKFWQAVCILIILVITISAVSQPFIDDFLSFIKDISSIAATILTAYVAIILFQDWRDIKKIEILSQHSTEIFPILDDLASSLFFLKNSLGCTISQFYKLKQYENTNGISEEMRLDISSMITNISITEFVESSEKIKKKLLFISQSVDSDMQHKIKAFISTLDQFLYLPFETRELLANTSNIEQQDKKIDYLYNQLLILSKEIFLNRLIRYSTFNDLH